MTILGGKLIDINDPSAAAHSLDDIAKSWGGLSSGPTAKMVWDTTDPDGNALYLDLPAGGAVDVPVFAIGIGIVGIVLPHPDTIGEFQRHIGQHE